MTLHGSGGGRRDIEQKKWQGAIRQLLTPENQQFEALVLEPQSDGEWDPDSLQAMLDYVLRENPDVDTNRLYCVGYSMGGKGTWEWAMHYPDRFAAIIPKGFIPDLSKLDGMVDLPIWAMVGDKDSRPRCRRRPGNGKSTQGTGFYEGENLGVRRRQSRDGSRSIQRRARRV